MSGSRSSAKKKALRFLPSLRDWGNALVGVPAVLAGLAAMDRAKARRPPGEGDDYFVAFAVALAVYAALIWAWTVAERWIRARKRSRPTV